MITRHPLPLFGGVVRSWLHCSVVQPTQLLDQEGKQNCQVQHQATKKTEICKTKKKLLTATLKICHVKLEKSTFDIIKESI